MGTQISQLAFPLLILFITHSAVQAGIAGTLRALPYLLVSLPAGALVDRWNRKKVMILCDIGRAIALLSIPLTLALGHLTFVQVAAVALIEGTLYVFFNLAEISTLPRVVPATQVPAAVARNETTANIGYLLGPTLGGLLFGLGRMVPFLVDGLSYLGSVFSLLLIKTEFQEERSSLPSPLWEEIREGIAWLWQHRVLRFLAILTGIGNLVDFGVGLTIIVFAEQQHASPLTIGLMIAGGGLGGIIGSLLAPVVERHGTFRQIVAGAHWIWGILLCFLAFAPNPLTIGSMLGMIELVVPIFLVAQYSYRLAIIPDGLRGRITSVYRLLVNAGQPIGLTLAGVLIQVIHPAATVLLFAAMILALAVAATLNPHLRWATQLVTPSSPREVAGE